VCHTGYRSIRSTWLFLSGYVTCKSGLCRTFVITKQVIQKTYLRSIRPFLWQNASCDFDRSPALVRRGGGYTHEYIHSYHPYCQMVYSLWPSASLPIRRSVSAES